MRKSKIYGYCRISTPKQNIDRQERNIKVAYPDAIIVKEIFTGTKFQGRSEFDKILNIILPGDTIVFDSVSRMSRTADEGIKIYFMLYEKGIHLVFLNEHYIDTAVYEDAVKRSIPSTGNDIADIYIEATNKVIRLIAEQQIRKAFEQAEKEVEDLRQRTREGIETARLNGKQIGAIPGSKHRVKKKKPAKEKIKKYSREFNGTLSDADCMKLIGLSRNTYYRYKKELKEEI